MVDYSNNPLRRALLEASGMLPKQEALRQFIPENHITLSGNPSANERVVKVGNNTYWRTGDKYYSKGPDGVRREISDSEYNQALDKKRGEVSKDVEFWTNHRKDAQQNKADGTSQPGDMDWAIAKHQGALTARSAMAKRDDMEQG